MLRLLLVSLGCVAALSPQRECARVKKGIHVDSWSHQAAQRVAPALLAGILSATAVPAYAIEPSPAALQIVQSALESSSQQKPDAVSKLDKAISTWKSEKLPDDELAGLYRLRADARNRLGAPGKAVPSETRICAQCLGGGPRRRRRGTGTRRQ